MSTYEIILADVAQLPIIDRIQLFNAIWDMLPIDSLPPLSNEWNAEIQKRSQEFDLGLSTTILWEQIKHEALPN